MKAGSIQRFELNSFLLQYDYSAGVLLCKSHPQGNNLWVKKIDEKGVILDIIDSDDLFFIAFEDDDVGGEFIAVEKTGGKTRWVIPGRAYMYRIYGSFIFLIFVDGDGKYFFIKSSRDDGGLVWHHAVDIGLAEYSIKSDYITLTYCDGRREVLDFETGEEIR